MFFISYIGTGAATWVSLLPYYCVCVWELGKSWGRGGGGVIAVHLATWLRLGMGT